MTPMKYNLDLWYYRGATRYIRLAETNKRRIFQAEIVDLI